jgi:hypothetical protein
MSTYCAIQFRKGGKGSGQDVARGKAISKAETLQTLFDNVRKQKLRLGKRPTTRNPLKTWGEAEDELSHDEKSARNL